MQQNTKKCYKVFRYFTPLERHLAEFLHFYEVDKWPATPKRARTAL